MVTFKKLQDDTWGVIGDPDELIIGAVTVQKKNGETTVVEVVRLSSEFVNREGETRIIGYLASTRSTRSTGCGCQESCCRPRCRCNYSCNCHGGYIYNC